MKIAGKPVQIREVVIVKLNRKSCAPIELKVSGFPIGIRKDYELVYPKPVAPQKATGKVSVATGPEMRADFDDPAYVKAFNDWIFLEKYFYLYHCLQVADNLTFDSNVSTLEGLRKIPEEFKAAGFSEGDIGKLFEGMNSATDIKAEDLIKAEGNFS